MARMMGARRLPAKSRTTWPFTYGVSETTPGISATASAIGTQSWRMPPSSITMCGSKPRMLFLICSPNPVNTAITTTRIITPSATPRTLMTVMTETKLRFGFR